MLRAMVQGTNIPRTVQAQAWAVLSRSAFRRRAVCSSIDDSVCVLCNAGNIWAVQIEPRELQSPITGAQFRAKTIDARGERDDARSTGIDSDGCRHSSGISEYDMYVITDPHSYFSALAEEWKNGRLAQPLSPEFKQWILVRMVLAATGRLTVSVFIALSRHMAARGAETTLPKEQWVIEQESIPH